MQIRWSTCKGIPIVERGDSDIIATLSGILIHPDSCKIEGCFVQVSSLFNGQDLFCSVLDIIKWGIQIEIRDRDALAPVEERIRLQPLLEDGRSILGQKMRTESGRSLGRCKDLQIDAKKMRVTWLFPRQWMRWGIAVAIGDIIEVRRDAIVVRDPPALKKEERTAVEPIPTLERLQDIADTGVARPG